MYLLRSGLVIGSNLVNSTVAGAGTLANTYGAEAFYRINPSVALNGWVGYMLGLQ
ncbi:MAG: hypothetical protein V7K50_29510 [Nostoc sp.]|uniref:hypothetical protein n=1 Tax=Nostoc sp. TaxID=1180 RepID=UPI002FF46ABD